jgi:hypothetical protein
MPASAHPFSRKIFRVFFIIYSIAAIIGAIIFLINHQQDQERKAQREGTDVTAASFLATLRGEKLKKVEFYEVNGEKYRVVGVLSDDSRIGVPVKDEQEFNTLHNAVWNWNASINYPDPRSIQTFESSMRSNDIPVWGRLLGMLAGIFIFLVLVFCAFLFIWCLFDLMRSEFIHPHNKALWLVMLLVVPLLGVIFYLVLSPKQKVVI